MKKFFKVLICFVMVMPLALSFVACKNNEVEEETDKPSLIRTQPESQTGSLLETPNNIIDLITGTVQGYRLGLTDPKNNIDFYNTVLKGNEYLTGSVPQGYANWVDISNPQFNYYETSVGSSTFFLTDYFPLANFSSLDTLKNNEEHSSIIKKVESIHKMLNLQHYLMLDRDYQQQYKHINTLPSVEGITTVNLADVPEIITSATKVNGKYYEFLTKPMPLMVGERAVTIYDFAHVNNNAVTDTFTRVYVDAQYGVCLGADVVEKVRIDGGSTTFYEPIFRTYFAVTTY